MSEHTPDCVTMRTVRTQEGVTYEVIDDEDTLMWRKSVRFGSDAAHRAGGYEFRNAAHEQEVRAAALAKARP